MRRSRDRVVDKKRRSGNKSRSRAPEGSRKHARGSPSNPIDPNQPARPQSREVKKLLDGIGTPRAVSFKPDPFQVEALAALEFEDVLVTAPTGSGKTWIAREEIRRLRSEEHTSELQSR